MIANFNPLGSVISVGVIILIFFIVLRFFRAILSLSFVGFILSLISYFVYDYIFATVPVVAAVGFVFSVCGFTKSSVIGKVFAVFGVLISGYIILKNYGLITV